MLIYIVPLNSFSICTISKIIAIIIIDHLIIKNIIVKIKSEAALILFKFQFFFHFINKEFFIIKKNNFH